MQQNLKSFPPPPPAILKGEPDLRVRGLKSGYLRYQAFDAETGVTTSAVWQEKRRREARRGKARRSGVKRGEARRGKAWQGEARFGEAGRGEERRGEERHGKETRSRDNSRRRPLVSSLSPRISWRAADPSSGREIRAGGYGVAKSAAA
ncbi:hypothetical protein G5I_03662 [Acromyrmex echinatior]|uniref:Uncharacterized protein n=1 Tax=Acromyrmex echinatior TaxID=103372 RepID=F4WDK8_ACREC|nr:hypothetical protein G5I_03662 [Acromyrmex echinatior]